MNLIYKITNDINNKVYIGQTTTSLDQRWREHKSKAKNDNKSHMPILFAMRKYGVEHFHIECLEDNLTLEQLDEKECYYIGLFNSKVPNGYNVANGGRVRRNPIYQIDPNNFEIIKVFDTQAQAAAVVGCSRGNMSSACSKNPMLIKGYYWCKTEDYTPERFFNVGNRKRVEQIDIETNEVLNTFPSYAEAARSIGQDSSCGGHIGEVVNTNKTAYGYKWRMI